MCLGGILGVWVAYCVGGVLYVRVFVLYGRAV